MGSGCARWGGPGTGLAWIPAVRGDHREDSTGDGEQEQDGDGHTSPVQTLSGARRGGLAWIADAGGRGVGRLFSRLLNDVRAAVGGGGADVVVEAQPDAGAGGPARTVGDGGGACQVEGEGVRGRRAIHGILGQSLHDHSGDRGGNPGRRGGNGVEVVLPQLADRQGRVERRRAGQQQVEHDSEGVQVRGRSQPPTGDLFGGHVGGGSRRTAGDDRRSFKDFCDAEVGDLEQAGGVEQHVVRLYVAVQHPMGVRAGQRCGHRQPHGAGPLRGQIGPATGQRPSGQELHDDQMQVVSLDIVVDPDHMRMVHGGEYLSLGGEIGRRPFVTRGQDLDRNIAVQSSVPASQHQAECSRAEFGAQVVAGQARRHLSPVNQHVPTVAGYPRPTPLAAHARL